MAIFKIRCVQLIRESRVFEIEAESLNAALDTDTNDELFTGDSGIGATDFDEVTERWLEEI